MTQSFRPPVNGEGGSFSSLSSICGEGDYTSPLDGDSLGQGLGFFFLFPLGLRSWDGTRVWEKKETVTLRLASV